MGLDEVKKCGKRRGVDSDIAEEIEKRSRQPPRQRFAVPQETYQYAAYRNTKKCVSDNGDCRESDVIFRAEIAPRGFSASQRKLLRRAVS